VDGHLRSTGVSVWFGCAAAAIECGRLALGVFRGWGGVAEDLGGMELGWGVRIMRARGVGMEKAWEWPKAGLLVAVALCGFFGVLSGYAIFFNYEEIAKKPWHYALALLVAAVASYFIEYMRELVRTGDADWGEATALRSVGTFVILLVIEMFIGAFHSTADLSGSAIMGVGRSLLGAGVPTTNGALRVELVIALSWALVGAAVATALALCVAVLRSRPAEKKQLAQYGAVGAFSGFVAAPILLAVYFLAMRVFVTMYYAVGNAQEQIGAGNYSCPYGLSDVLKHSWYCGVPVLLRAAQFVGPVTFAVLFSFLCLLLPVMVVGWIGFLPQKNKPFFPTFISAAISFALAVFVAWPLLKAVGPAWKEFMQVRFGDLLAAMIFSAVVWVTPGLLLGCLTPLLRDASRSARGWAFIGYGAAAALAAATFLRLAIAPAGAEILTAGWPLLAAGVAAGAGTLFLRGLSPREHWPLAALCVAIGIVGVSSISQAFTFREVMTRVVRADEVFLQANEGSEGKKTPEMLFPEMGYFARLGYALNYDGQKTNPYILHGSAAEILLKSDADREALQNTIGEPGGSTKVSAERPAEAAKVLTREEQETLGKRLELCVAGGVGFWITVGLLACWTEEDAEKVQARSVPTAG